MKLCKHEEVETVGNIEFAEDGRKVISQGLFADAQGSGDLLV